jgi:hypothetical protein
MKSPRSPFALLLLLIILAMCASAATASAEGLTDVGGAEWHVEQPPAPEPPVGVEGAKVPVGLGRVGDIEFEAPDRGALITAGNGSTVPPGVWTYNGAAWHELSTFCGASDRAANGAGLVGRGRIVWAGPDEFWTISDGRPGQAAEGLGQLPPLEDNTLCHFALNAGTGQLEIVGSYASLAFQSTSYQAMDAGACVSPTDCWFGGDTLPAPAVGSFQLHWNGATLTRQPYINEGHQIGDMAAYEGRVIASVRVKPGDPVVKKEGIVGEVPALHAITTEESLEPFESILELPLLQLGEFPSALDYLHLSGDEDALWGAAAPARELPAESKEAGTTILRYSRTQFSPESHEYTSQELPSWQQVLGPCPAGSACEAEPPSQNPFGTQVATSIAAEPATHSAWVAVDSKQDAERPSPASFASVARLTADGSISDRLQLPLAGEPYGAKGGSEQIACPAPADCWMVSTQGWLFHLSTPEAREHPAVNTEPAFSGTYLVHERPPDEGVPQENSVALVEGNAGEQEQGPPETKAKEEPTPFVRVTVPLLSRVHTHLVHGTTLELTFHLSVKARVRLLAKRKTKVVASTPMRVFKAGNHSLLLALNAKRWPTKLALQTHALAPLKTVSTRESNVGTVSTGLSFPAKSGLLAAGHLP